MEVAHNRVEAQSETAAGEDIVQVVVDLEEDVPAEGSPEEDILGVGKPGEGSPEEGALEVDHNRPEQEEGKVEVDRKARVAVDMGNDLVEDHSPVEMEEPRHKEEILD
jgi:predicted NBD/HSP70 family sugar kinase